MKIKSVLRLAAIGLFALFIIASAGCSSLLRIKKPVKVHPLLTPLHYSTADELISEVNRQASLRSIRGKVDIQFEDNSFAESGLAEKYRTADGTVTVQRPGQIFLQIQVPFIGTDVAQMTSDGTRFRVAVLQGDEKYRRFVMGTNSAAYSRLDMGDPKKDGDDKAKIAAQTDRAVSVLSNLRPQHFTDAFLLKPINTNPDSGLLYAQSEIYEDEPDIRLRASKDARIVRGYYQLDELAPGANGIATVIRRFWFDRVGGIRLARLQTYDAKGILTTDVVFSDPKPFGEKGIVLPSHIELTRPQDHYKISLTYQAPDSVSLDHEYPAAAFVLENKWGLPEVDLDQQSNKGRTVK